MRNGRVSVPAPSDMICLEAGRRPSPELVERNASINLSSAVVRAYVPAQYQQMRTTHGLVNVGISTSVDDGQSPCWRSICSRYKICRVWIMQIFQVDGAHSRNSSICICTLDRCIGLGCTSGILATTSPSKTPSAATVSSQREKIGYRGSRHNYLQASKSNCHFW